MGERTVFVAVAGVVSPLSFVTFSHVDLVLKLDVFLDHGVWAGFAVVEMSEWAIVVAVAAVMSPIGLIGDLVIKLNIFLDHAVWRSFTMVEVGEWTIVVAVATSNISLCSSNKDKSPIGKEELIESQISKLMKESS